MNKELKTKWISALRSGNYEQGRLSLQTKEPDTSATYCCLGVLACVSGRLRSPMQMRFAGILEKVDALKGLIAVRTQRNLASMNDNRQPFSEIADHIEKYL